MWETWHILVPFPTPCSTGLGSFGGTAVRSVLAAPQSGGGRGAGSCWPLPAPLTVVSFLHLCWNRLPPELLTGLCWEALGIPPLVSLSSRSHRPEPPAQGTRQEGGTQPTCVRSYKGGNWPCSLQTVGLVFEFWLLLRGYLYVGFVFFVITTRGSRPGFSADPTSEGFSQGKKASLPVCSPGSIRKD